MERGNLYLRLKALTKAKGKSLNQVEKELNYPRNALNNYKTNCEPSAIRVMELSEYFGVSPQYLIGLSDQTDRVSTQIIFSKLNHEQKLEMFTLSLQWINSQSVV